MDFAVFGFVALVWWTWPIVFVVVMAAVWAGYRLENWREDRKIRQTGPHPCLAHMGEYSYSHMPMWCGRIEGHGGEHVASDGLTVDNRIARCDHEYERQGKTVQCALLPGHEDLHDSDPGTVRASI